MEKSEMSKYQILRKISVDFTKFNIVRIRCMDKHGNLIGNEMGDLCGQG